MSRVLCLLFYQLNSRDTIFLKSQHILDPTYLPLKKSVDILAILYLNDFSTHLSKPYSLEIVCRRRYVIEGRLRLCLNKQVSEEMQQQQNMLVALAAGQRHDTSNAQCIRSRGTQPYYNNSGTAVCSAHTDRWRWSAIFFHPVCLLDGRVLYIVERMTQGNRYLVWIIYPPLLEELYITVSRGTVPAEVPPSHGYCPA